MGDATKRFYVVHYLQRHQRDRSSGTSQAKINVIATNLIAAARVGERLAKREAALDGFYFERLYKVVGKGPVANG